MQVYVHLRERNVQPDFGEALVYFFVHVEKDAPEIVGAGPYAYDDVNRTVAEARQRDEMGRFGKYPVVLFEQLGDRGFRLVVVVAVTDAERPLHAPPVLLRIVVDNAGRYAAVRNRDRFVVGRVDDRVE